MTSNYQTVYYRSDVGLPSEGSQLVFNPANGVFENKIKNKLYFGYSGSTSETTSLQNVWQKFPYPSSSISTYRDSGSFSVSDDGGLKITCGTIPSAWYYVSTNCNVYKGSGSNQSRNIEFVWRVNDVENGPIRGTHMNNLDSQILCGIGQLYLETGDIIEPYVRNIENDDKINLKNCSFDITQEL